MSRRKKPTPAEEVGSSGAPTASSLKPNRYAALLKAARLVRRMRGSMGMAVAHAELDKALDALDYGPPNFAVDVEAFKRAEAETSAPVDERLAELERDYAAARDGVLLYSRRAIATEESLFKWRDRAKAAEAEVRRLNAELLGARIGRQMAAEASESANSELERSRAAMHPTGNHPEGGCGCAGAPDDMPCVHHAPSAERTSCQRDRAIDLFVELAEQLLEKDFEAILLGLQKVLEEAQNDPPLGQADGSLPPEGWELLSNVCVSVRGMLAVVKRVNVALAGK